MLVQFVSQYLRGIFKWRRRRRKKRWSFPLFPSPTITGYNIGTKNDDAYVWKSLNLRLVCNRNQIEYETRTWKAFSLLFLPFSLSVSSTFYSSWNVISVEFSLISCGKQTWKAFNEIIKINIDKEEERQEKKFLSRWKVVEVGKKRCEKIKVSRWKRKKLLSIFSKKISF